MSSDSVFDPKQINFTDGTAEFWPPHKKLSEAEETFEVRFELVHLRCPKCSNGHLHHQTHNQVAADLHICDSCGCLIRLMRQEPYPRCVEVLVPKGKEIQP